MDPSALYLQHLDWINRVAASLCARHGIRGADAEDFASEVRLRLLQDDYSVLRKYRGTSSVPTFLTVVIGNLFRDYRIKRWGKWRPSAEAKRRGEAAVLLETAVYRDGRSFDEACQLLRGNGRVNADPSELRRIMTELPRRVRLRQDDDASVDSVPTGEETDGLVLEDERVERSRAVESALKRALTHLDPDDRLIIMMHFFEAISVADIARGLGLPQKPLYPRIKRLLDSLSSQLTREGIGPEYLDSVRSALE
jgi:RNA polymerase sigma factor (sigma-70 family)